MRKPCQHRVQYYETDQMGVVHHANYIRWFEEARSDFMEQCGMSYRSMEEMGIIIPVVSVEAKYVSMSRYWDVVDIAVRVTGYNGIRISFAYEVTDHESGEVRCTGESSHCFLDREGNLLSLRHAFPEVHRFWGEIAKEDAGR